MPPAWRGNRRRGWGGAGAAAADSLWQQRAGMDIDEQPLISPSRERSVFRDRNMIAFWILGLLNNYSYVIMFSAAEDIIAGEAGAVLVADVLPTLIIKATAPFWAHKLPYATRVYACTAFALAAFYIVAMDVSKAVNLMGVMCASIASGWGETTFLAMSSFYDPKVVTAWSSGTGMAGIAGAGWYLLLTDPSLLDQSPQTALLLGGLWPAFYAVTYRFVLERRTEAPQPLASVDVGGEDGGEDGEEPALVPEKSEIATMTTAERWERIKPLLLPYMLPLMVVYFCEYVINTGVSSTIGFPDPGSKEDRKNYYVLASFVYQVGVFASRSSATVFPLSAIWPLPLAQAGMLFLMLLQAMFQLFDSAAVLLCFVFVEGLFGGLTYVNAFTLISTRVEYKYREFSMAVASVGDSCGIMLAAVTSLFVECALLQFNDVDMDAQDLTCIY